VELFHSLKIHTLNGIWLFSIAAPYASDPALGLVSCLDSESAIEGVFTLGGPGLGVERGRTREVEARIECERLNTETGVGPGATGVPTVSNGDQRCDPCRPCCGGSVSSHDRCVTLKGRRGLKPSKFCWANARDEIYFG
jgi:hypothetical protein